MHVSGAPREAPLFRGPVLVIDVAPAAPATRALLVQHRPPARTTGRVWVYVVPGTRIVDAGGAPVGADAIRVGTVVGVWATTVEQSDPAQAGADWVAVDPRP